ncbi:Trehalose synthase [Methanoculleus chikugoensis]|jgi:trehalose synthase|uniref:Trehalose synthase n=1 Tax=Methanoculleus chikugoensis TaxID=118126 RepID=A0A1M4MHZ1_9EURY|nr:glycosyltransferase [Methanoculleus chikugoensis]MDD4566665.1 glycosyltransferase [Methanoculleus chikugoensis]NMA10784.1 glycosyltransferase [Methanomicrobiales archaeon]SCL74486.1 Trehalose synthase [Methanoculleus chikugoensis]
MIVTDLPGYPSLREYQRIAGTKQFSAIEELAGRLSGVRVQEINSTRYGGGVSEILISYVPFLNALGLDTTWSVMEAEPAFFDVTKTLHNFLQGRGGGFSPEMIETYWEAQRQNEGLIEDDSDVVTIHDPQPLGLVEFLTNRELERKRLLWRCHVQLETIPTATVGSMGSILRRLVEKYHAGIFSSFQYLPLWNVPSFIIPPFIDPLSEKNRDLPVSEIDATLAKYGIDPEKPIVTQVSRYDTFKDPVGVIQAFKMVRRKIPCQLVLVGGRACDDPECFIVLREVRETAEDDPDIHILDLPPDSHREINAIQRASDMIVQKSIKEGFGLTVTEGLWKEKPVIAGSVGGIPLQIRDGWNGYLVSTIRETADRILHLLRNPELAHEMGARGREFVREYYLLTRGVQDHLTAIDQVVNGRITARDSVICYHPQVVTTRMAGCAARH